MSRVLGGGGQLQQWGTNILKTMRVRFLSEIKIIKMKREKTRTLWNWTGSRDTDTEREKKIRPI